MIGGRPHLAVAHRLSGTVVANTRRNSFAACPDPQMKPETTWANEQGRSAPEPARHLRKGLTSDANVEPARHVGLELLFSSGEAMHEHGREPRLHQKMVRDDAHSTDCTGGVHKP